MADQPAANPAPVIGTPEYDAAMIAKAKDGGVVTQDHDAEAAAEAAASEAGNESPAATPRPEHIPEKFWDATKGEVNVEAMAKSYAELEKMRGQPKEPTAEEKAAADKATADAAAAAAKAGDTGGDALRAKAEQEWMANETLSEETFAAYEKVGVTREQIGSYIEGQKALASVRQQEAYGVAGSEEQYKAMQSWALANLTDGEKEAYDRDVFAADKAVRTNAITGLVARYAQANGTDGKMVTAASGGKTADAHFTSKAAMIEAMSDPQYKTSPAYRAEVASKVAASLAAGVYLGMS